MTGDRVAGPSNSLETTALKTAPDGNPKARSLVLARASRGLADRPATKFRKISKAPPAIVKPINSTIRCAKPK